MALKMGSFNFGVLFFICEILICAAVVMLAFGYREQNDKIEYLRSAVSYVNQMNTHRAGDKEPVLDEKVKLFILGGK
jgi:hypothetical protein